MDKVVLRIRGQRVTDARRYAILMRIIPLALVVALLGCTPPEEGGSGLASQQAVLVYFKYGSRDLGAMFALEESLS